MENNIETRLKAFHNDISPKNKKKLEAAFPEMFAVDPYIKACEILGITPIVELAEDTNPDLLWSDAGYRLAICIRAKNLLPDGSIWKQKYDGNESHYWPVFKVIDGPSGLGLAFNYTDDWDAYTSVGARLEYRTAELAREGATEFIKYYTIYHIYEPK